MLQRIFFSFINACKRISFMPAYVQNWLVFWAEMVRIHCFQKCWPEWSFHRSRVMLYCLGRDCFPLKIFITCRYSRLSSSLPPSPAALGLRTVAGDTAAWGCLGRQGSVHAATGTPGPLAQHVDFILFLSADAEQDVGEEKAWASDSGNCTLFSIFAHISPPTWHGNDKSIYSLWGEVFELKWEPSVYAVPGRLWAHNTL